MQKLPDNDRYYYKGENNFKSPDVVNLAFEVVLAFVIVSIVIG